jgi:hypothetical protein
MKRTGFARKEYMPEPKAPLRRIERSGVMARITDSFFAVPKIEYVRSKPLLKACREIPCQACMRSDGTIVAAHSNEARHGKGRSVKASDQYVASLCHLCHHELDQGSRLNRDERQALWAGAHAKTVRELVSRGLWPLDVPIPDLRSFDA